MTLPEPPPPSAAAQTARECWTRWRDMATTALAEEERYGYKPGAIRFYRRNTADFSLSPTALLELLDAAAHAQAAEEQAIKRYAYTVDDPRHAHLHYDGCPYKPFADALEEPEDAPACTCADAHKAAYWKGQFVLERGAAERELTLLNQVCDTNETLIKSMSDLEGEQRTRAERAEAQLAEVERERDADWRKFVALTRDEQIADLRHRWEQAEARERALREALLGVLAAHEERRASV